jgi:hypothetical protein
MLEDKRPSGSDSKKGEAASRTIRGKRPILLSVLGDLRILILHHHCFRGTNRALREFLSIETSVVVPCDESKTPRNLFRSSVNVGVGKRSSTFHWAVESQSRRQ